MEEPGHRAPDTQCGNKTAARLATISCTEWVAQHERQEAVGSPPTRVRTFLKDFQALDVRRAKALLQTILSAAHVYRDGRIELEFR